MAGKGGRVKSRSPGRVFRTRDDLREDEAKYKKFALGGSTEIWISGGKVDVRGETWLPNFVVPFLRLLFLSFFLYRASSPVLFLFLPIVLTEEALIVYTT